MKLTRWALVGLLGLSLAQIAWYFPRMPARMATHFGVSGRPDGFMGRGTAGLVQGIISGVMAAVFGVLPALVSRLPASRINLPHRDFWLAPDRRGRTLSSLRSRLEVLGCGVLAFLIGVSELMYRANLAPEPRLPAAAVGLLLAALGGFLAGWTALLLRRFGRPPGVRGSGDP